MKKKKFPERESRIKDVVSYVRKKRGNDSSVMLLSDGFSGDVKVIPTGVPALDKALMIGGMPRGRTTELFGPEMGGKTTLCLHVIAEAQKMGGVAAFVDAEHALDVNYAKNLGVGVDDLIIAQPDCGEEALEIVEALVEKSVDVVVVDSVAALTPRAELDGEMGDQHVGIQARLMGRALRKLTALVSKKGSLVLFINQLRMKIGVMFGNPEDTPGGRALKFYASVRLDVRKKSVIKDKDGGVIGNSTRIKVVKNKLAPPFKEAEVDLIFGKGFPKERGILDMAVDEKIIERELGSWFSYGSERIGHGRENACKFLEDHAEVCEEIESKLKE